MLGTGIRLDGERMIVYVRPSGQESRAGFVCPRRVGGAVARNRARRILREAWRAVVLGVPFGYDFVFVARPPIDGARTAELVKDMERTLGGAGMMAS